MDSKVRNTRAATILQDEVLKMAFEEIKARTVKELLAATTDQDRAEKWHDHRALERVERCLQQWAAGPKQ